jgi:hypothetical protein
MEIGLNLPIFRYGQQPPQQQQYIPPTPQQQYEASVAAARVRELQPDYFQQQVGHIRHHGTC